MSAPLVLNITDGTVWRSRPQTRDGEALYALEGAPQNCPDFTMSTYAQLAEHGITGAAFALPMPVGLKPRDVDDHTSLTAVAASLPLAATGPAIRAPHDVPSTPRPSPASPRPARDRSPHPPTNEVHVEQAALAPTEAPEPQQATFQHATAVICQIVPLLDLERRPFSVEIEEDWPSGWRVHLKFRETRAAGLLEFAALLDVPVTNATTAFGVHLDAITRIETVEVRASALVSPSEAARLEGEGAPAPTPQASASEQAIVRPVPLGSSVLATQSAVVAAEAEQ